MKTAVSSLLCRSQTCYKYSLAGNISQEQTFNVGDYAFVDFPSQATIASDGADRLATHWYNRLWGRLSRPYKLLIVQSPTATIEDRIANNVPWTALCFHHTNAGDRHLFQIMQTIRPLHKILQQQNALDHPINVREDDTKIPREYVVSEIVRHLGTLDDKNYVMRSYRYTRMDDTLEPSHYIPCPSSEDNGMNRKEIANAQGATKQPNDYVSARNYTPQILSNKRDESCTESTDGKAVNMTCLYNVVCKLHWP